MTARPPILSSLAAALALALAAGPPAHAADRDLSLPRALSLALDHHPDLLAAGINRDSVAASVEGAKGAFDPTLSANSTWQRAESAGFVAGAPVNATSTTWQSGLSLGGVLGTGTSWSLGSTLDRNQTDTLSSFGGVQNTQVQDTWAGGLTFGIRQDLLAPLRSSAQRQGLRRGALQLDEAEISRRQTVEMALDEVATAWWTWVRAEETLRVASSAEASAAALEATIQEWLTEGITTAVELSQVRASRLEAELNRVSGEASVRDSQRRLQRLLGAPLPPLTGAGAAALLSQPIPTEDTVLNSNLSIALAQAELRRQQQERRWAGGDMLPTVDVLAEAGVRSLQDSAGAATSALVGSDALPSTAVGMELSVPLGNRTARANRSQAELAVRQAKLTVQTISDTVLSEYESALDARETATRQVALATARLAHAQAAEDGERARIAEGMLRTDQLLDAVDDRLSAEAAVIDAKAAVAAASIDLLRLEGNLAALAQMGGTDVD